MTTIYVSIVLLHTLAALAAYARLSGVTLDTINAYLTPNRIVWAIMFIIFGSMLAAHVHARGMFSWLS